MSRPGSIGNVQSLDNSFTDFEDFPVENTGSGTGVQADGKVGSEPVGQQTAEDVGRQLDAGEIDGAALVKGARVDAASPAARALAASAAKRSLGSRMLSAIGRFLMGTAHAVKSFFTLDILRPSWYSNNVAHFDYEIKRRYDARQQGVVKDDGLEALPDADATPPHEFDKDLVAVGTGFGGKLNAKTGKMEAKIEIKPFNEAKRSGRLYPAGRPRLKDVIQNPALQDCWFLSGITAILSAKGPEAITRLIEKNEDDTYTVRLMGEKFIVPNGEVCCDGESCVSHSAPWVKILEQAAAMYMATRSPASDMIMGNMSTALKMLSGGQTVFTPKSEYVDVDLLIGALENHVPVMIGHVGRGVGIINNIAGALRDNISPGHAVTLLNVQRRGGHKAWLTVMDPYGRTRIISSSAIKRCSFVFGCSDEDASHCKRSGGLDGSGEILLKEV